MQAQGCQPQETTQPVAEHWRRRHPLIIIEWRAESVRETRQAILDAAAECFAAKGIRQTSMQEVARTANVSAGTVTNHFPRREELVEATLAHIGASLPFPPWEDLASLADPRARLLGLVKPLYKYYQAGDRWVHILFTERDSVPAVGRQGDVALARIDELISLALGPAARDEKLVRAVQAVLHPSFRRSLLAKGASRKLALDIASDTIGALFDKARTRKREAVRSA